MTGALLRAGSPELGWKDAWGRGKYRGGKGTVGRRNGLGGGRAWGSRVPRAQGGNEAGEGRP